MIANSDNRIQSAVLQLLLRGDYDRDLTLVVQELRHLADDASIKAAVLRLQSEGRLQITLDWKLRLASAAAAGR